MESLKIFAQEWINDDIIVDLGIFYSKVKFAFRAFIWEKFKKLVEDFGAKVNKMS